MEIVTHNERERIIIVDGKFYGKGHNKKAWKPQTACHKMNPYCEKA